MLGVSPDSARSALFRLRQNGKLPRPDEMPMNIAAATGAELRDVRLELLRDDGSILQIAEYVSPLRDSSGKVTGSLGVIVDVTAHHRNDEAMERRIAERTSDAQHRAEQLRDLALALADAEARERKRLAQRLHDGFQQFLSAARLKAAIVRRKLDGDSAEAILAVERMLEQAIDESRALTTELSPPVLYDAGLNPAVETLARNFERQRGIKVSLNLDSAAEPQEEQVRVLLFEAVRELLTNVAHHAKAKNAGIAIRLCGEAEIDVTVCDDGIGFDPAVIENPPRRPKLFGLMEIRERLKYIGGGMELKTSSGAGTRVRLFVPTALRRSEGTTIESAPTSQTPAALPRGPAHPSHGDRCRILVADDHAIFREGLINLLFQDPDLEVIGEAADGEEAVELALRLRPDILLVDVTMPKMSGIEVTARLSRELPEMKIVGLSMHEQRDMSRAMCNAGAAAYVTKGGSSEALLALLRDLAAGPPALSPE
jgi:signal transduction histidine kinase/ActR/RegA family two-component response regulator